MPLDEVGLSKAARAGVIFDAIVEGKGNSAMNYPSAIVAVALPVADRRIRAGFERLEEEEVLNLTNSARMGGNSPIPTMSSEAVSAPAAVLAAARSGGEPAYPSKGSMTP